MKNKFYTIAILFVLGFTGYSCTDELEVKPLTDNQITSSNLYNDPANYEKVLAKLYGGLALTGTRGPAGSSDISFDDEGFGHYMRNVFKLQEISTDEAKLAWGNNGIQPMNQAISSENNAILDGMYRRLYVQVALANELIRNIDTADKSITSVDFKSFRAEARFLRALSYYHALDLFGNVTFITEADESGSVAGPRIERAALYDYVVSELKDIENNLLAPRSVYGRADQAAAWMLLARVYLNAEVYSGSKNYEGAAEYAKKVIDAGYTLNDNYAFNFTADNHKSPELIFTIPQDGTSSQTWGGMTFIINSSKNSTTTRGTTEGWAGTRTTAMFANKFNANDQRALFGSNNGEIIDDLTVFTQGVEVQKFSNLTSEGVNGSSSVHVDTDIPVFRLADAHLMYIEAAINGATNADLGTALTYANALRKRAFGNASGNVTAAELTNDWVLDERGRELYWEATRRTDLIRHKKYTSGDYLWDWKGGVKEGRAIDQSRILYHIPQAQLLSNPNLKQNTVI